HPKGPNTSWSMSVATATANASLMRSRGRMIATSLLPTSGRIMPVCGWNFDLVHQGCEFGILENEIERWIVEKEEDVEIASVDGLLKLCQTRGLVTQCELSHRHLHRRNVGPISCCRFELFQDLLCSCGFAKPAK